VLRDRSRNVLFNHLGLGEDQMGITIRPDCADLPYFLRAYFAFKMGLPFGYSKCSRGSGRAAPRCPEWFNIQRQEIPPEQKIANPTPSFFQTIFQPSPPVPEKRLGLAQSFGRYLQAVAGGVHSGSARTLAADNNTDYYPVPLTEETLRPGTVY